MGEQELNLFAHSSQRVEGRLMEWADLVLVMTENHAEILRLEFPEHVSKVFLLSEMKDGRRYDVSDPYGRSLAEYESCANLIKKLINDGWDRIRFLAERSAEGRKGA
jgi:protein-tyrosine-phosphatase